jgi:predicted negative regulator of RcsB-dependent stress response
MRATLEGPALTGQAGRFVWLALDYDKPVNQPFFKRHGVGYTPSFFVLDPKDERATASHTGGMTLPELMHFLDEGERGVKGAPSSPADQALARGDEQLGRAAWGDAVASYKEAIGAAPAGWPERPRAIGGLTWAMWSNREAQACAETAMVEAPNLPPGEPFARVILAGFACAYAGPTGAWTERARQTLEPLAEQALAQPGLLRDHRFQLYQHLMQAANSQGDSVTVERWSHRFLDEIEAVTPANENERSALDIARVDAAVDSADLARILPALEASERAMPTSYNASLRLAETLVALRQFDAARKACDRGLVHVTGPLGKSWLLSTKSDALLGLGDRAAARAALRQSLAAAQAIGNARNRDSNVRKITQALAELDQPGP